MKESLKVHEAEFEGVVRALLNTSPIPLATIPRKREPKAAAKKRG